MKKAVFLLAATITMSMLSVPVFAHGGHGRGNSTRNTATYAVCAVEDCAQAGLHAHDGTYYYCAGHGAGCGGHGTGCTAKGTGGGYAGGYCHTV